MPEGPEVEVVRLGLSDIIGKEISKIKISKFRKYSSQKTKLLTLGSSTISNIERRGKFLLWFFSKGESDFAVLNHLGMTGSWHFFSNTNWKKITKPFEKYKHFKIYFHFTDGDHLLFNDPRTFGQFTYYGSDEIYIHKAIDNLGPDILQLPFDDQQFIKRIRGKSNIRKIEVGKALLNPKIVAGCGNIYKSEALFKAGINPFTKVNLISDTKLRKLGKCLSEVGQLAIKNKGTTLRDYSQVDGYSGLMQNKLEIYGREGESCNNCNKPILASRQGDRTTFWCKSCQK
ncbi:MAG: bifunctional DNA-formamidopyrimidine glycosylase/DNA-(apurinic or apyrimidinic site) lyase [Candidatus Kariarchaeaceae archaeon]